ncbi:MAG: TatD family hydrolase [Defluviitaleaceae bacterium]|nr:TatD family hydrolase [Defluviitaleaceae bacterium]
MQQRIIDTHAHYDNKQFDPDRNELLASMAAGGIKTIINVGCSLRSSKASIELAKDYPFVYATVGVHPHDTKSLSDKELNKLEALCSHEKVVAYGEIGLDFFHNFSPPDVQRHWFKEQLQLADSLGMPVVIHSRDAGEETFEMIEKSPLRRGVVHSFSGDIALAWAYTNLGFHVGVGGVVTYDKTMRLQNVVDAIPLEKILLETDAPYLTPAPYRGKRNNSSYLTHVATKIAEIKGISYDEVCAKTTENAQTLFGL